MDRRQFLVAAGRIGLGAGLAAVAAACDHALPAVGVVPIGSPIAGRSSATPLPSPTPARTAPPPIARDTAIADENRRVGSRGWHLRGPGVPVAQAFVDAASVAPGETLDLHLGSPVRVDAEWYRLGWYGGMGGRLVRNDRGIPATPARQVVIDHASGRAEAPYDVAISAKIPADWPSGLYFAVVRPAIGTPGGIPFVVRPAPSAPVAPILFVSAAATWQAYNEWGGADLYGSTPADTPVAARGRRAVEVSFDRPYELARGAGLMPRWELPFIRWQERAGRAADYCADIDLELHPELVRGRRLIVFAGHHEYWSRPMRATLETAIASGVNVAFLSANEIFWQVRLGPSPLGPARRITCWKSASEDPLAAAQPSLTTCRWRDEPVNDPEAVIIGQMYGHVVQRPADWVVQGADHWLYERTGFRNGDRIVNLVGQEYDTFFPAFAQPGTTILARSPVDPLVYRHPPTAPPPTAPADDPPVPPVHTATIYTAESGATVFAAGTFQWSWALDGLGRPSFRGVTTPHDARVARMTANLFDRLGDGPRTA